MGVYAFCHDGPGRTTRSRFKSFLERAAAWFERPARMKLDRLESAAMLKDLASLPGNRFEALSVDRKGQYSIRINDRWRVCFEWPEKSSGPANVEIVDYH